MAEAPSGNLLAFLSEHGYRDLAHAAHVQATNPEKFANALNAMPQQLQAELANTSFNEYVNAISGEELAQGAKETFGMVNDKSIGVDKIIAESQANAAANAAAYEAAKAKGDALAEQAQQQLNEFRAELNAEKAEFIKNQPPLEDMWAEGVDTSKGQIEFEQAMNVHQELTNGKESIGDAIPDPWAETGKAVGGRTIGSTVAGIGEIGLGATLMVQGTHQIRNETEQTNWVGKVRNRALVGIGAGVATDGALRAATGQGWVERVAEQAGNAISHFQR